jgi:transposase
MIRLETMMVVMITRTDRSADDLRIEARRVCDAKQSRRLLALAALLEGASRYDAARMTGMDRQTLRDWVHRYNAEGVAGLVDRPRSGRPSLLAEDQLTELDRLVETGPDPVKDGVVRWRCLDLKAQIATCFGVQVSERSVGRILNERGFRRLSPRPEHPKTDAAAQEAFKQTFSGS